MKKIYLAKAVLPLTLLALTVTTASAQEKEKKSLIPSYLSVGGWVDAQYSYENQENADGTHNEVNTFQIRRARLDVKGNITDKLEFRLQGEFANSPKLIDAFIKYKFHKRINVQVGQFKTPFTLENQYSPLNQEGIENSLVIGKLAGFSDITGVSSLSAGRDIGVSIYGDLFPFLSYNVGLFSGHGINSKDDNLGKDIIGRLDIHPGLENLTLSGSFMQGSWSSGGYDKATKNRYAGGAEYKDDRLTIRSEYVYSDLETAEGVWKSSKGVYAVVGYWFTFGGTKNGVKQKIRPVLRYDWFKADSNADHGSTYYMAGIDYWPDPHLRLQLDYTLRDTGAAHNTNVIQLMATVKF